jgi:S-adenosylmethionine:tRNA ribosyltransferase-isomerase
VKPATEPHQRRPGSKLLVIDDGGRIEHAPRSALLRYMRSGDLLVANDAATIPASLSGTHRTSGEPIEVRLAGRQSLAHEDVRFVALAFGAGNHRTRTEERPPPPPLLPGDRLALGPLEARVEDVLGHPRLIRLAFLGAADTVWAGIARHGRPIQYAYLPEPLRLWDVWTRVATLPAAFEPPSASFVLDWALVRALGAQGIGLATLTHAAGISSTGDPRLDSLLPLDEPYRIPLATVEAIGRTRAFDGRVVALGTTVTRALEHAASRPGGLRSGDGLATLRIGAHTPLRIVDAILTGTHQLGESHYDLLHAFAGAALLARMTRALEEDGYLAHEFGDSVLLVRQREGVIAPT